eukprot:19292-Prymnesium_polylepis.1
MGGATQCVPRVPVGSARRSACRRLGRDAVRAQGFPLGRDAVRAQGLPGGSARRSARRADGSKRARFGDGESGSLHRTTVLVNTKLVPQGVRELREHRVCVEGARLPHRRQDEPLEELRGSHHDDGVGMRAGCRPEDASLQVRTEHTGGEAGNSERVEARRPSERVAREARHARQARQRSRGKRLVEDVLIQRAGKVRYTKSGGPGTHRRHRSNRCDGRDRPHSGHIAARAAASPSRCTSNSGYAGHTRNARDVEVFAQNDVIRREDQIGR